MWENLIAKARTLAMYYHTAHWQVHGSLYYSDHLLFERLYNSSTEDIDKLAERAIGITGDIGVVNLNNILSLMCAEAVKLPYECKENIQYAQAALLLEKDFISCLNECEANAESAGTKDLLAGISDKHEEHIYLLQQRVSK
jgi:starvation-inducible DNA-binding protein